MKRKPFNPRDYYALSLAAALDRLAREAKIVDCCTDPRKRRFVPMPDEGWPWVFIDYRRFDPARRAARDGLDSPLGAFLRSKPVLDETDAVRQRENQAFIDARGKAVRAFEDAVCPLIEALRAGHVVARGFRKGRVAAEDIDPARWSMGWIIKRKDETAQVEFFTDATSEDAEVILNGLRLAAPDGAQTPSQGDGRRAAGGEVSEVAPQARKPGNREANDTEALLRLIEIFKEGRYSLLGACTQLYAEAKAGKVKLKLAEPKSLAKRLGGKLKKTHEIIEAVDGTIATVRVKQRQHET